VRAARIRSTLSATASASVLISISGLAGGSYGSETPVKWGISQASARF